MTDKPVLLTVRWETHTNVSSHTDARSARSELIGIMQRGNLKRQGDGHMGHLGVTHGTIDGFLVKAFYEITTDKDN